MNPMPMLTHPKTFDEVIARGFPHEHLHILNRASDPRRLAFQPPAAPRLAAPAGPAVQRKSADTGFGAGEQGAFRNAVTQLVEEGTYRELVGHHMDMNHNMHGSMGEVGLYRFLGWHRRYLVAFERELQRVDALLRPGAMEKLGVPYWTWQDPIPTWMEDFLPAPDPTTGAAPPVRKEAPPPEKANANDLDLIVNQFSLQDAQLSDRNDYTKFTCGLEGWGLRPDGSSLPGHNHGHAWIGGIMNNTSTSPSDPMFWLHHAEVDRLWEIWRQANPTPAPLLNGTDRIMDPWAESYDELLSTKSLGYVYDSLTS